MADSKISALAAVASLADTDELILASAGMTKKITGANLKGTTLPGYGTSLPASPVNGQEFILVDSLTAPTYQWRLRYNASNSSAYKWEFVGGTAAEAEIQGGTGNVTTAYPTFTTNLGPTFTVPRAGVYHVGIFCQGKNDNGPANGPMIGMSLSGANQDILTGYVQGVDAGGYIPMAKEGRATAAAGNVVQLCYTCYPAGTSQYDRRVLTVLPVRVS